MVPKTRIEEFRVYGSGFSFQGSGLRIQGSEFRVSGSRPGVGTERCHWSRLGVART